MTPEQIKQNAKEYCESNCANNSPFERPVIMSFILGANSRQPEIDELVKALRRFVDYYLGNTQRPPNIMNAQDLLLKYEK